MYKNILFYLIAICCLALTSCRYQPPQTVEADSIVEENESIVTDDSITESTHKVKKSSRYSQPITLKEYVENLRNDGMTMFHMEGDNVLIFTRWDDPVGGNANSQAELLYRQAKASHVRNIKTVRIVKMPEKKVVGRYVHK